MTLTVNGKSIQTDEQGYLSDPNDWDEDVMQALIEEHQRAGHKPLSETAIGLVEFTREFYEEHQKHPSMHELLKELGRHDGEKFAEAHDHKAFLYDMFPHGPVQMLAKLAGLHDPGVENEG